MDELMLSLPTAFEPKSATDNEQNATIRNATELQQQERIHNYKVNQIQEQKDATHDFHNQHKETLGKMAGSENLYPTGEDNFDENETELKQADDEGRYQIECNRGYNSQYGKQAVGLAVRELGIQSLEKIIENRKNVVTTSKYKVPENTAAGYSTTKKQI